MIASLTDDENRYRLWMKMWSDLALDRLRAAGLRRGGARRLVVQYLEEQDCCRSAQEIHDGVAAAGGAVGVASVYRALDTLAELRLVQRVDTGDGVARFEPARADHHHHHHQVCDDCGRVEPFTDEPLERALERAAGRLGYALEQHDVVLRGACEDCRGSGTPGHV
jgi:Fur family ferric uptake transcriptional regulator